MQTMEPMEYDTEYLQYCAEKTSNAVYLKLSSLYQPLYQNAMVDYGKERFNAWLYVKAMIAPNLSINHFSF